MRDDVSVCVIKIHRVLHVSHKKWALFASVCRFVTFYPHFSKGLTHMARQTGVCLCTYILSCSREAGAATIFCFFNLQTPQNLPDQTVSSLGKRPIDDDHDHHSLRGRLAQCKPSMSSTVRTFFGVEQLRAPPSRPQSCYVCQRQTTKVKDKIITHYTYKEWRHKELGWPSSPH